MASIEQLRSLGFSDTKVETPHRLIVSVSGREKTGKTHFALTAPGPIIFFNIDIGTEGVISKFQADGKRVFIYDVRVPKGSTKDAYAVMWNDIKSRFDVACGLKEGTIVIDTSTEAYELARLAHFGKLSQVLPHHYVEVNSEWRELLRLAYDSAMNVVFIHKMKPKWVNNQRTSDYELSGFSEMGYLSQINLVTYREDNQESRSSEFSVLVQDCRQNPNTNNQVLGGPMCNFEFLLNIVHGE